MKLSIDSLETVISLDDPVVTVIAFEDVHFFSRIVKAFYNSINDIESDIEIQLVDDSEKRINLHSRMDIIFNPLLIDFSNRKIVSALADKLKRELNMNIETRTELEKNLISTQELLLSLLDDFNLAIDCDDNWDAPRLIKAFSLKIENNSSEMTQLDILCKYMSVVSELKMDDYFCFIGLNNCLSEAELTSFYQEALRNQVSIICVEHRNIMPEPSKYAKYIFIDKDYEEFILYPYYEKMQFFD